MGESVSQPTVDASFDAPRWECDPKWLCHEAPRCLKERPAQPRHSSATLILNSNHLAPCLIYTWFPICRFIIFAARKVCFMN